MKLNNINTLRAKNSEKKISKKILLANSPDKTDAGNLGVASPQDPIYFSNNRNVASFSPDIRYRNNYGYSPLADISARNALLLFAENKEIKKALKAITNEIVIKETANKYPVSPVINLTHISEDKQEVARAIQKYIDEVFWPKLYKKLKLSGKGLRTLIREYLTVGKLAFEIVYDNLERPKEIENIVPIDPSSLEKYKDGDNVWYVQKPLNDNQKDRVLHENQVIIIEWNEFDFGHISYIDELRRSFNIMRSMQSAKIGWFAAKSQVRMHINLNLGDMARTEAITKLQEMRDDFTNHYYFNSDTGETFFNGESDLVSYHEYYTAETAASGKPDIEEVNSNGPDLTEIDSIQFWQKCFWNDTEIPYDRIEPNSNESWGFLDANAAKKTELNFSNFCGDIKDSISLAFLKPIIIQLTLKEVEIGIDLSLLDSIKMDWVSCNDYTKLAELEIMDKKIGIAKNVVDFGEVEDVNGKTRKLIPVTFVMNNFLDFTPQQYEAMDAAQRAEFVKLGFNPDGTEPEGTEELEETEEEFTEDFDFTDDDSPADTDNENY